MLRFFVCIPLCAFGQSSGPSYKHLRLPSLHCHRRPQTTWSTSPRASLVESFALRPCVSWQPSLSDCANNRKSRGACGLARSAGLVVADLVGLCWGHLARVFTGMCSSCGQCARHAHEHIAQSIGPGLVCLHTRAHRSDWRYAQHRPLRSLCRDQLSRCTRRIVALLRKGRRRRCASAT